MARPAVKTRKVVAAAFPESNALGDKLVRRGDKGLLLLLLLLRLETDFFFHPQEAGAFFVFSPCHGNWKGLLLSTFLNDFAFKGASLDLGFSFAGSDFLSEFPENGLNEGLLLFGTSISSSSG